MSILKEAWSLLLPPKCCVCGKLADTKERLPFNLPGDLELCFDCMSQIVPEDRSRRWILCLSNPYIGDPIPSMPLYMPFKYEGFFKKAVASIKFGGNRELASFLGAVLGNIAKEDYVNSNLIIPIPLSQKRLEERGYNQAQIIAQAASEVLGIPCVDDALIRTRDTLRQSDLKEDDSRAGNISGAFKLNPAWDIKGARVIIVDDVATTGHTLHEAAELLMREGAAFVAGMVLCGNRYVKNADPF